MTHDVLTRSVVGERISTRAMATLVRAAVTELLGSPVRSVQPLKEGASSANFVVKTKGRLLVARIDLFRSKADLEEDSCLSDYARQLGVPVPSTPVILTDVGGWPLSVREFILGATADKHCYLPKQLVRSFGRHLARIHTVDCPTRREFFYSFIERRCDPIWDDMTRYSKALSEDLHRLSEEALEDVRTHQWLFGDENKRVPYGFAHNDYKASNLLVTQNKGVVVLDWEKATHAPLLFDLSLSLFHLLCGASALRLEEAAAFLAAYRRVRRLEKHEQFNLTNAILFAAGTFFLTDMLIAMRNQQRNEMSAADRNHQDYFASYCVPCYRRLSVHKETIRSWLAQAP
jgi:aminoglycoside phosphotransferase (APT) family kinase protein